MTRRKGPETWRQAFVDLTICGAISVGIVLILCCLASAQTPPAYAPYAVVEIPSHGASGTVIYTGPGRTLILSCAHMFLDESDRPSQRLLHKPLTILAPCPVSRGYQPVRMRVLKVDFRRDLSLIEMTAGPLPYCSPVAPAGFRPGLCWSVGFDEMKADHIEPSHILGQMAHVSQQHPPGLARNTATAGRYPLRITRCTTMTQEPPWHGRSGGALIDQASGRLVGVVQGYTADGLPPWLRGEQRKAWVMRHSRGLYVDLTTIHQFLGDSRQVAQENPSKYAPDYARPCPPGQCPMGEPCPCPQGQCPCPPMFAPQTMPQMMGQPMGGFCVPGGG